jgi:hypothetical protein
MTEDSNQTLFGLPVVVTDATLEGTAIMGRWPTWQDILEHGSFEKAIEAQKREWIKITGLPAE